MNKGRRWLRPLIGAGVLALAAFLLYRALEPYSFEDIVEAGRAISGRQIALGLAFTAGSFLCLSLNDRLAVHYARKCVGYPRVAAASFTAVSIGHLLGFAALSSGALRYRFYSHWGATTGDVGRIMMFCGTTVAIGMASLGGLAAVFAPAAVTGVVDIGAAQVRALGVVLLALVLAYLAIAASSFKRLRIRRFVLPVPDIRLALGQVVLGTADMLCVSAVLYQMLSVAEDVPYATVAIAFVSANLGSAIAHVPGGLGVVEAVVLTLVPGAYAAAGLVVFRVVYFLLPFMLGCAVLAAFELVRRRAR